MENIDFETAENEVTIVENAGMMRTASVVDRILKVIQGIAVACIIVAAIFIPLVLIFGEKMIADASELNVGVLKISFIGEMSSYLDMGNLKLNIVMTLVSAMVALAAGWYCIRVLRSILAPMKEGKVFAEGISKKVRTLGWTVLIGGGLAELGRLAEEVFTVRAYRLPELISHPSIASVEVGVSSGLIHPWFVFAALLLFFLSFVFRCGEKLQRESDETL